MTPSFLLPHRDVPLTFSSFLFSSLGPSHANGTGNNNGTWGDREPIQGDDHSLVYPNYSHTNPTDCGLLLMGSTVANPTALGGSWNVCVLGCVLECVLECVWECVMMGNIERHFYLSDFIVCWSWFYLSFLFLHLPLPLTFLSNPYL